MAELLEDFDYDTSSGTLDIEKHEVSPGSWGEALEEVQKEYIESGVIPTIEEFRQRTRDFMTGVPSTAERKAEQGEIAGIFLEQQQTIYSLDSILREKAAEPSTTGTLYAQPPPPGSTGTNFALLIGIGLGLWLLMKMKK